MFIHHDSHICDRLACRLEADGFHVLTTVNHLQGLELVKVLRPDAVLWSESVTWPDHAERTVWLCISATLSGRGR